MHFLGHLEAFLRKFRQFLKIRIQFDAEGVIGFSSPYKCTAERTSATKKPHNYEETHQIPLVGFNLI